MKKVFYSWQSDRLKTTGRNLVHRALVDAINMLKSDADVEDAARDEVLLDSDTQNVPGSPPIVETIFGKIDAAAAFVADLTFVGERSNGRPVPNPNVTIEYGYALRALSHSRIIGVMNAAHGEPTRESLPFDLGHMRHPITYNCPDDADDEVRGRERKQLAGKLKAALKAVLDMEIAESDGQDRVPYSPTPSLNGEARFRAVQDPVGMLHDGSQLPQPDVPILLAAGPAMWLRVMPQSAIQKNLLVTQLREALINNGDIVRPLNGEDSLNPSGIRGADGYGLGLVTEKRWAAMLVYAFTSGELWSLDTLLMQVDINRIFFDPEKYAKALVQFADMLIRIGVKGPYQWIAGIDGMKGRRLAVAGRERALPPAPCLAESVVVEGEYSGVSKDARLAIEPFVERVFDAGHLRRS